MSNPGYQHGTEFKIITAVFIWIWCGASISSCPNGGRKGRMKLQQVEGRIFNSAMFRKKHSHNDDGDGSLQRDAKVKELNLALGPLSGRSSKFCTDACLRRYLVARNWNVDKAKKMLEETLKWRATYKPEEIRWHEVAHEGETGKVSRANFHDRLGRPVLIMRPGKQNSNSAEGNIRHLVYMLENAILNLPEGQEQMVWLIDYTGWSISNNVPIKTARETAHILQNHYPERLALGFLYNPPRIFEAFWKVVKYFLDPITFEKVKFIRPNKKDSLELMRSHFDMENLPQEFGGNATLEYDHEEFSKLMVEDDAKAAKLWGLEEDNPSDHAAPKSSLQAEAETGDLFFHSGRNQKAEVAPDPEPEPEFYDC